jgi:predicted DNA-binding protein (MmcQ/YjbR family)
MTTLREFRNFCKLLPKSREDFPFDDETLVLKIGSRMFALTNINAGELKVNLKCEPALARDLRAAYGQIEPGWHMNKEHWNTVTFNDALPPDLGEKMIRHSYELVVRGLSRKERLDLGIDSSE